MSLPPPRLDLNKSLNAESKPMICDPNQSGVTHTLSPKGEGRVRGKEPWYNPEPEERTKDTGTCYPFSLFAPPGEARLQKPSTIKLNRKRYRAKSHNHN